MLRYLGKTKDLARPRESEIMDVRSWGNVQALFSIANEVQFSNNVNRFIQKGGGVEPAKLLLILVINRLLDPCSKRKIESWYKRTALESIIGVKSQQLSAQNLCSFLDYLTPGRIDKIERGFARTLKEKYDASTDCIIYDITSTYTFGSIEGLSNYGYSRDHRSDLEQINIGLAVTERDFFPVMHQVFEGNVPDVVTLPGTANMLDEWGKEEGIPKITLIHDRGFLSKDNIELLDSMDRFDFVCGVKRTSEVFDIIDQAINEERFEKLKEKKNGDTVIGSISNALLYGKERRVVVIYSSGLEKTRRASRTRKMAKTIERLNELKSSCCKRNKAHDPLVVSLHEVLTGLNKYFDIEIADHPECNAIDVVRKNKLKIDKRKLTWMEKRLSKILDELGSSDLSNREIRSQINNCLGTLRKYYTVTIQKAKPHSTFEYHIEKDALENASRYDGYYALTSSNPDHSMKDIVELYDSKDGVEKAFYTIKHPIRINPIRHWNPQRVRAHVFVCVMSYLIYSVAKYKLKTNDMKTNVLDVLDELGDIKQYRKSYSGIDKEEMCLTHISKNQKELLSIFGFEM